MLISYKSEQISFHRHIVAKLHHYKGGTTKQYLAVTAFCRGGAIAGAAMGGPGCRDIQGHPRD